MNSRKGCFALVLAIACLCSAGNAGASNELIQPLSEIARSFPNSLRIKENDHREIEFCPDNTCELFISKKGVPERDSGDFVYLFLFYFSDYFVLKEWRTGTKPVQTATEILSESRYKTCRMDEPRENARCVLRRLSEKGQIALYAVRYDEGVRSKVAGVIP